MAGGIGVAAAGAPLEPQGAFMIGGFLRYCIEKIEFSPSFISDLVINTAYVLVTAYLYVASAHVAPSTEAVIFIAVIVLEAQAVKVVLMFSLDWRGGDASSKQSHTLVTSGVYGYSRNPAYFVTVVQNVLWSLLLLLVTVGQPQDIAALTVICALPVIHFFALDRIVRREEADLARWHPAAYAAYAGSVNRWIGRRQPPRAQAELSTAPQGR
jgi:protein-S-isoprenylcysteine O-methyltransferase Ste14